MVHLNQREKLVCSFLLEAFSNKEIAKEIGTSVQMVKNILYCLYNKVGVSNRLELALTLVAHPEYLNDTIN